MNQRNLKIIKKIKNSITVLVTVIFLFLAITPLFSNKTIVKEIKENKQKELEQEGENYRLVTSADNVQVPVPKGYVASQVTGENYVTPEYSHTTITHKILSTPTELQWSSPSGEPYPWTQDENGIWISGNQGIPNSTSTIESEEFDYVKGSTLTINYTYSSQYGDFFNIYLIDLTNNITTDIVEIEYGNTHTSFDYITSNYTYSMNDWGTGRYKIRARYSKNSEVDEGQDSAYIKISTYFKEDENGTETVEEDIKTRIHEGGFVIYQLTDEEIETDPNGTNVIINDTNKDEAQSERNQYVWVPVENIEDIVRTKTINNGIMQFGQGYVFSNTSITKVTYTGTNYFREPRLVENYDKTKFYLQKYSYIDKKREEYLKNMQEEYNRMINSINKYKGYYIGRYETSDNESHNSRKTYFKNPKVVRYANNIGYVSWYESYRDLKKLSRKAGKYSETGIIYDSLWEYTLKWFKETDTRSYEDIANDCGKWGNYWNNSFKYKESANGIEKTKDVNSQILTLTGGITEITYKGETYRDSPTASNNIFDMAGNLWEWTRAHGENERHRRYRGGVYGRDSYRTTVIEDSSTIPESGGNLLSVRAQLYIL